MAREDSQGISVAVAENPRNMDSADEWKQLGGEAYKQKDWENAVRCYASALERCDPGSELAGTCLNNRAACYAQLGRSELVIKDATEVIRLQPANIKALMRRMVAFDSVGKKEEALKDAASVLTMEPKNVHALAVVEKKKKSLTKKATDNLPKFAAGIPSETMAVFLFTENRPLQCYACMRSLKKHLKDARLNIYVFWQAQDAKCIHSYQLLQSLNETSRVQYSKVNWVEVSNGQLFPAFSRTINKLSVEGEPHVLLLTDTVVFHTDVELRSVLSCLSARSDAWTARLDINPRIDFFPEANLIRSAPLLQNFAEDPKILLWTRWYDTSKKAFEKVDRETGWDAILEWTATIIRTQVVQHFFSALLPPMNTLKELDEKAADWLSRRQRMKRTELKQRAACYKDPVLVTIDPSEFGSPEAADRVLRAHLLSHYGIDGNSGEGKTAEFAEQLGWKAQEVTDYFKDVEVQWPLALQGLLNPDKFKNHYFCTVQVPALPPTFGLPKALDPPSPLVSWLIPARNAEFFLKDCLASVEAQAGIGAGVFEVIIVEDGSEDATLKLARQFAEGRPYVKVIDNAVQMGVAGALVEGWPHCRGDFVARLDADDEAMPQRLLKQLRYFEQHPCISVLGGRVRPFWTELRKCTIENLAEKEDGRVTAVAFREFHGNQTSRQRDQLTFCEKDGEIRLSECPSEYEGCRVVRIGEIGKEESILLNPKKWREALRGIKGYGKGQVILQRRDPLEPPKGSRYFHPMLIRAMGIYEECLMGTTLTYRRSAFPSDQGPLQKEEAEGVWSALSLEHTQHAANLADCLVRARRHDANREPLAEKVIQESTLAAVQHHLTRVHGVDVDLQDAAAIFHFRGPRTIDQGEKLSHVLQHVEYALLSDYVRPKKEEDRGEFWKDFVQGREAALEKAISAARLRWKELADESAKTVQTCPEHSPRQHRSRTPPR
jgi:glycosyltransferase involved in cell wall biosynthesis